MTPARQLGTFLAKYDPEIAATARAARARLRKRMPTAHELVYDNYNALVIGYCPTERPSDAILSIVLNPRYVSICFIQGKHLPDPTRVLRGSGNQVRTIRLEGAHTLDEPAVRDLVDAAIEHGVNLPVTGRGRLIIRSISKKQRPRRPPATRKKTAARRSSR
jgi:hypothetical protein